MNNYHIALLNPCKEYEEKKAYYANLITKLWDELRSCHYGENSGSDVSYNHEYNYIGMPIALFNSSKLFLQLIVPNKLINNEDSEKQTEESVTQYHDKEMWVNLSEDTNHDVNLRKLLARLDAIKTVEGNWSENIAEQIHHIADQLPYFGYILNINWLVCGHSDCVNISNNIPLYGALKRLHTWNNACITLVFNSKDFCNTNFYESWNEALDISLLDFQFKEPFTDTNIVWFGSLTSLEDQQTIRNLDFNSNWNLSRTSNSGSLQISTNLNRITECESKVGISESKEAMLTDTITIISELNRCNIELWKTLPCKFILYHKTLLKRVFEIEKSTYPELNIGNTKIIKWSSLFNYNEFHKSKFGGLVVQSETVLLASIESCHGNICRRRTRTTEDWIDFVHTGVDRNSGQSRDRTDSIETFHLLLYPLEPGIFNVYFLRPEKSFCNLHSALSVYGASFSLGKPTEKSIDELRKVINSLPWISIELFAKWKKEFDEAYFLSFAKGLSNVKDKSETEGKPELSPSELWEIILTSYSETSNIHNFSSNIGAVNGEKNLGSNSSPFCIPEHVPFDQETWPERQWLNTICGAPESPFKGQFSLAVHLDASEMLKHFTKDGKPLKKELESLRRQIEEKRNNSPPKQDIEKRRSVGIEYCTDSSVPSSIHSFSPKLLPKHVKHETLSICNTPKTLAKAKLQGVKRKAVAGQPIKKNPLETTELDIQPSTSEQVETPGAKEKKAKSILGKSSVSVSKKTSSQQRNRKPKKQIKQDNAETKKVSSPEDTKVQMKKRRSFDASEASLPPGSNSNTKEKRSDRHKRRLAHVVKRSLLKYGVEPTEDYFDTCSERLYYLCKSFLKDLTTSEGLNNEMKRLAESNVANVVEFEKRRQATKLAENQA